jgi:hypothetical protein
VPQISEDLHDDKEVLQRWLLVWDSFEKASQRIREQKRECEPDLVLVIILALLRFSRKTYARLVKLPGFQRRIQKL